MPPKTAELAHLYRTTLLQDIVPFWLRHGIDRQYGGIGNILDERGQTLGTDKYLWSQGRALWTFSALCNRIEDRKEWREFAAHIFSYIEIHAARQGRDAAGSWAYRLDAQGELQEGATSIFVDGFVMAGLGEYYQLTGNEVARSLAIQTCHNVLKRLAVPGSYGVAPYELPAGRKMQGVAMLFSFFFYNLGQIMHDPQMKKEGLTQTWEILNHFYQPPLDAVLEFTNLEGRFLNDAQGRTCVPGHALEALWFSLSILERQGLKRSGPAQLCCRLIRRHLELAWDREYGGLQLAVDVLGAHPIYWPRADCKPWWVHAEALVATAYAHRVCGEPWCLEWHEKVREWAFSHYPHPQGEWMQWLDREGKPAASAALPVKDPFHLPRALIYLSELLD